MQEELTKKLIDYIEKSKDFVLEQAPDIMKEMLEYHKYESIVSISFLSVFIIGLIITAVILYKKRNELTMWWIPLLIVPVVFFGILCDCCDLIKVKTAPKYFILSKLVKNTKS